MADQLRLEDRSKVLELCAILIELTHGSGEGLDDTGVAARLSPWHSLRTRRHDCDSMQASRHAQPLVVGDGALQLVRETQGGSKMKRIE